MARPKSPKTSRAAKGPAGTVLRAHRLSGELVRAFELECEANLRSPRMVVEALMRYWLAADPKSKASIAAFRTKGASRAKRSD